MTSEKFEVRNRWSGAVQFTAEIEAPSWMGVRGKVGLAVKWAIGNDADLRDADLRGADLRGADLSGAVLSGADLSGADLNDADLRDADLRGAVLSGAVLSGADLSGAVLRGADLSGAPIIENIHQKVYAAASAPDALNMGDWHTCETTHCRAGWVTTLAGKAGRELEQEMGTAAAASLIYLASDPTIDRFPNFYTNNDAALADMKRLAEIEAARAQ